MLPIKLSENRLIKKYRRFIYNFIFDSECYIIPEIVDDMVNVIAKCYELEKGGNYRAEYPDVDWIGIQDDFDCYMWEFKYQGREIFDSFFTKWYHNLFDYQFEPLTLSEPTIEYIVDYACLTGTILDKEMFKDIEFNREDTLLIKPCNIKPPVPLYVQVVPELPIAIFQQYMINFTGPFIKDTRLEFWYDKEVKYLLRDVLVDEEYFLITCMMNGILSTVLVIADNPDTKYELLYHAKEELLEHQFKELLYLTLPQETFNWYYDNLIMTDDKANCFIVVDKNCFIMTKAIVNNQVTVGPIRRDVVAFPSLSIAANIQLSSNSNFNPGFHHLNDPSYEIKRKTGKKAEADQPLRRNVLKTIAIYMDTVQDLVNLEKTCKAYNGIISEFRYNPVPLYTRREFEIFNHIEKYLHHKDLDEIIDSYSRYSLIRSIKNKIAGIEDPMSEEHEMSLEEE